MMRRAVCALLLCVSGCGGEPFQTAIDGATAADGGADVVATPDVVDAATPPHEDAGACSSCPAPNGAVVVDAGCCGTSCLVAHTNGVVGGLSQTMMFYDCEPRGAYTLDLAMEACSLYFGTVGADGGFPCIATTCDGGVQVVEAANQACIAWAYGGDPRSVGRYREGQTGGPCECPSSGDPMWY